jgi:hypothetical protein
MFSSTWDWLNKRMICGCVYFAGLPIADLRITGLNLPYWFGSLIGIFVSFLSCCISFTSKLGSYWLKINILLMSSRDQLGQCLTSSSKSSNDVGIGPLKNTTLFLFFFIFIFPLKGSWWVLNIAYLSHLIRICYVLSLVMIWCFALFLC